MPRAPKYRVEATAWQCLQRITDSLGYRTEPHSQRRGPLLSAVRIRCKIWFMVEFSSFRGGSFSTGFLWCQVCYLDIYCQIRLSLRTEGPSCRNKEAFHQLQGVCTVWSSKSMVPFSDIPWLDGPRKEKPHVEKGLRQLTGGFKRFVSTDECEMLVAWLSGHDFLEVVQDPQAGLLIHGEMMWDVHIKRVDISWYFSEGLCAGGICESPGCILMRFVFWTSRRLGQWPSDPTICSVIFSFRFKRNGPHYTGIQQVC